MIKQHNELFYQISRQQRFRLLRSTFDVWEYNALQSEYERQRRIVAGETATGILNIKKALKCWKTYSQWKRKEKKSIRHTALSNCLHRWFFQTVQITHEKSLNSFPALITKLVTICRSTQSITKMSCQAMLFSEFETCIKGFSAVGFCGLLSFVSRYTDCKKCPTSVSSNIQPTFLSNIRMLYVARGIRVESETWQGFFSLECINVPWPIHHGRLWNRHKALAALFRWALLKAQLKKWCFYFKYKKEIKRRRLFLSCRIWRSYVFSKKYNTRHHTLMKEMLRKTLGICLLRCSWVVWKLMFFKSLKLKQLCYNVVLSKKKKRLKSACVIWKESVTHRSLLKSREEFLTKQWTLLLSLRQWRSFTEHMRSRNLSIEALKMKRQKTGLRQHFIAWRMQFLYSMICQMFQKSRTEAYIKYVLVVWKRQADFQKKLEFFFLSCVKRMTQKSIQAWRYKALFYAKIKSYLLERQKRMVCNALYEWSCYQQWRYRFYLKRKYLENHLNQRQLNGAYNYFKRLCRLRQGCREAADILEKHVYMSHVIKRWVSITKKSISREQETFSIIQLTQIKRFIQHWKHKHDNLKEAKYLAELQQKALMHVLHKKKHTLWQHWFCYTKVCRKLRDSQVACQTHALFWSVLRTGVCSSENVFCHFKKKKNSSFGFFKKKNVKLAFNEETSVTFIEFHLNPQQFIFFWASLGTISQDIILHRIFKLKTQLIIALKQWKKYSLSHHNVKCLHNHLAIQQKQQVSMRIKEWINYVLHEKKKCSLDAIRFQHIQWNYFKTWKNVFNFHVHVKKTAHCIQAATWSKLLMKYWILWSSCYNQQKSLQLRAYHVHCQRFQARLASAVDSWSSFSKMKQKINNALNTFHRKRTFHELEHYYLLWKSLLQNRVQCQKFLTLLHVRFIQQKLLPAWKVFATNKVNYERTQRLQRMLFVRKRKKNCLNVWLHFKQYRIKYRKLCMFLYQNTQQEYFQKLVERHITLNSVWRHYCIKKCLQQWEEMIFKRNDLMKKKNALKKRHTFQFVTYIFQKIWLCSTCFVLKLKFRLFLFVTTLPTMTQGAVEKSKENVYAGCLKFFQHAHTNEMCISLEFLKRNQANEYEIIASSRERRTSLLFLKTLQKKSPMHVLSNYVSQCSTDICYAHLLTNFYHMRLVQKGCQSWRYYTFHQKKKQLAEKKCFYTIHFKYRIHLLHECMTGMKCVWRKLQTERHANSIHLVNYLNMKIQTRFWETWRLYILTSVIQFETSVRHVAEKLWGEKNTLSRVYGVYNEAQTLFMSWVSFTKQNVTRIMLFRKRKVQKIIQNWKYFMLCEGFIQNKSTKALQKLYYTKWLKRFQLYHFTTRLTSILHDCVRSYAPFYFVFRILRILLARHCFQLHSKLNVIQFWSSSYCRLMKQRNEFLTRHHKRLTIQYFYSMQKRVLSSLQERLLQTTVQKIIHCQIRGRYWMKWRTYYKQTVQLYSIAQRFHTWYSLSQSLNVWMRFTRSKCWIRSVEMTTLAGIFQCWKYTASFQQRHSLWKFELKKRTFHVFLTNISLTKRSRRLCHILNRNCERLHFQQWTSSLQNCLHLKINLTILYKRYNSTLQKKSFHGWYLQCQIHRQGRYQHFIKTIFDNTSDTIPLFKRIQLHYESFLKKETFKQLGTYTYWITKLEMIFLKRKFQLWKHLIHSLQQYAKDRKKKMFHVLQRWYWYALCARKSKHWVLKEKQIRQCSLRMKLCFAFKAWKYFILHSQALRVIRQEETERILSNCFIQWRLLLRTQWCKETISRIKPSILNGLKLNGFMDHSWSRYISNTNLKHIVFQTWLLRTYRLSWNRECVRRQKLLYQLACEKKIKACLLQWKQLKLSK